jgi:2-dehydro-3-deoxygluconokinase
LLQSGQFAATFAGAEANVAVALASLGTHAKMLSVLPDSPLGHAALGELRRHGVDVDCIKIGAGRLGLFFYTPGAVRRPSEVLYDRANSAFALAPELCAPSELAGADWFHVSGVTPALGRNCAAAAISLARAMRERGGVVSFDGNYRSQLWKNWAQEAPGILRQLFECADIVFGDDRDIALVLGMDFARVPADQRRGHASKAAFDAFPNLQRIACTTRSQSSVERLDYGAAMFTRSGAVHEVPAVGLSGIVDRLGTGDAFAAGVIHGLLTGTSDGEALTFGHAAACLKHSIPGDFMPLGADAVRTAMQSESLDVRR